MPDLVLLDARLNRIRQARPLPPETVRSLGDALRVRATWASNAIEGNSLTLQETKVVLDGLTVGGKPLRDHLEAVDHAEAWDAMIAWARGTDPLTPFLLRSLHALVLRRSNPEAAGRYRTVPVAIAGSTHVPPDPVQVPALVDALFTDWLADPRHPIVAGAIAHARLMAIHPFVDGNGRTGRLLLNLWLLRHDGVPCLLEPGDRPAYYAALAAADHGDPNPIVTVIAAGISRTVDLYERVLSLPPLPAAPAPPPRP